jgi:hypothetical protein
MNQRTKGHGFERWCAAKLRTIWPDVQTCRYAGNLWLDHCGVDLIHTDGFNFQCKAVERLSPGYHEILNSMPVGKNINAIIHKKNNKGVIVALRLDDFLKLIS